MFGEVSFNSKIPAKLPPASLSMKGKSENQQPSAGEILLDTVMDKRFSSADANRILDVVQPGQEQYLLTLVKAENKYHGLKYNANEIIKFLKRDAKRNQQNNAEGSKLNLVG